MVLIGVANSFVDVNGYTIIQTITPDDVIGRVFGALRSMLTIGMGIGALLMPALIELIGLRAALATIGTTVAATGLAARHALNELDTTTEALT